MYEVCYVCWGHIEDLLVKVGGVVGVIVPYVVVSGEGRRGL